MKTMSNPAAEPKVARKFNTIYWICTGLMSLFMVMGAIPDLLSVPEAIAQFQQLGFPTYLLPFLGVAKLLGVIAIIIPGFPRIKEWAYAGLTFDLAGASYSLVASGSWTSIDFFMILGFLFIAASYITYHKIRRAKMA